MDEVARHLAGRADLDVRWTAFQDPRHLAAVRRMKAAGRLGGGPVVGPRASAAALGMVDRALARAGRTRFGGPVGRVRRALARRFLTRYYSPRRFADADVLHSPFCPLPPESGRRGGPVRVLTAYDLIPVKFPQWFDPGAQDGVRLAFESLTPRDWVACISASTRRDLLEFRPDLDPLRVRVTPLAAADRFRPVGDDAQIAAVRRRIGLPDGAPYFLSLCTLEPRKNLRHVVRAFAELRTRTDADPYLVLVGSKGWQFEELLGEIAAAGRAGGGGSRVIATGFLPDGDLPAIYAGATAFVYLSLYEGFGLPPLEAMQCGTAVVTSDNSSLPEVVGDAGVMLPAGDREALVQTLSRLLEDRVYRDRLAAAGRERAAQFTWDRCGAQTVQLYQDAAAAAD